MIIRRRQREGKCRRSNTNVTKKPNSLKCLQQCPGHKIWRQYTELRINEEIRIKNCRMQNYDYRNRNKMKILAARVKLKNDRNKIGTL
jgi:hypothetical protein